MSLIQDALKRQQEESENSRVPLKAATAPSVPDVMPIPPSPPATLGAALRAGPEKPVQSGKSWKQIAIIIIFCVLIAWCGGVFVVLLLMPNRVHGRATLGKLSVQAPPPAVQPPAAAMSKPVVTPSPARASASGPLLSPAAAAAPAFADEGEDAEEDAALSGVKEQELPPVAPTPVPVVWPRLKLSAIFSNVGSGQAGARLNNRLVLLGGRIEGITLVEIRPDSVVLKCGKETRSLKMGLTLNGE